MYVERCDRYYSNVWCAQKGSIARVSSFNCAKVGTAPVRIQACNTRGCSAAGMETPTGILPIPVDNNTTYIWTTGDWSDCSKTCGADATRKRTVECLDARTGVSVNTTLCRPDLTPAEISSCTNRECQTYWYMSDWSQCSAECNGGMQQRKVECRLVNNLPTQASDSANTKRNDVVDDNACVGTKPTTSTACNLDACPSWQMSEWSECSVTCGDGIQTRTATCIDAQGKSIDDAQCGMIQMPNDIQACQPVPCGFWQQDTTAAWSPCSKRCNGGNSTLPLVCVLADGTSPNLDQHGQTGFGCAQDAIPGSAYAPPNTRICNIESCPTYYYDVRDYSACSKVCDSGLQTGRAVCIQSKDDTIVPNSFCVGEPPIDITRPCNTAACPKYEYFIASEWSTCSVQCGRGIQTRTVICVNTAPSLDNPTAKRIQAVDYSLCLAAIPTASPAVQRECNEPDSICYGLDLSSETDSTSDIAANGKCIQGTCVCRSGFTYQNCTGAPYISNVRTSMDPIVPTTPTLPLAFRDKIEIRWDYQGELDSVSVLVLQADANHGISQYIATDIPNTGRFLWTIGTNFIPLPLSDDPNAQSPTYRFMVWYSPRTFSTTGNLFTFSDPCAYLNCGVHGSCKIGLPPQTALNRITSPATLALPNRPDSAPAYCQCQQSSGFTGKKCEIGPCTAMRCEMTHSTCNDETVLFPQSTSMTGRSANGVTIIGTGSTDSTANTPCNCTIGWSGSQCRTPVPNCKPTCLNGGDSANVMTHMENNGTTRVVDSCGVCQCVNQWAGVDCSQCALRCINNGQASDDCARCNCGVNSGWFGSHCECRYYLLTMQFSMEGMSESDLTTQWFTADDNALVKQSILKETFRNDLLVSARQLQRQHEADEIGAPGSMMIEVDSLNQISNCTSNSSPDAVCMKNLIQAIVKFSLECPEQSLFDTNRLDASSDSSSSLTSASSPLTSATSVLVAYAQEQSSQLLSSYNLYASLFSNLDSPVYRGVMTSSLDRSIRVFAVSDPTGIDSPQPPTQPVDPFFIRRADLPNGGATTPGGSSSDASSKSTNLSKEVWIGIIVGAAVFLIIIFLAAFAVVKHRKKRDANQAEKIAKLEELGIRATSPNPAMHGLGMQGIQLHMLQPPAASPNHEVRDVSISRSPPPPPPPPHTTPASNSSGIQISGPRYDYKPQSIYHPGDPSFSVSSHTIDENLAQLREPTVFPRDPTRMKSPPPPRVTSPSGQL